MTINTAKKKLPRYATIKRMIAMPPKPHAEMKIGKPSKKRKTKRARSHET
jgi:hypothetical protein